MSFTIEPPIEPMLAKLSEELPPAHQMLFEPKWDGFRAIILRHSAELHIQSRDGKPPDRYFPELREACLRELPEDCVVDGEIVIATPHHHLLVAIEAAAPLDPHVDVNAARAGGRRKADQAEVIERRATSRAATHSATGF